MPLRYRICGKVVLQVHHKLYFFEHLPWEYEEEDVVVLCVRCHKKAHAHSTIYTYKDETKEFREPEPLPTCPKCNDKPIWIRVK